MSCLQWVTIGRERDRKEKLDMRFPATRRFSRPLFLIHTTNHIIHNHKRPQASQKLPHNLGLHLSQSHNQQSSWPLQTSTWTPSRRFTWHCSSRLVPMRVFEIRRRRASNISSLYQGRLRCCSTLQRRSRCVFVVYMQHIILCYIFAVGIPGEFAHLVLTCHLQIRV